MDNRAALRFPTRVEADCRSCDRAWDSRLVNISTTGCMIACPEQPLPDGALLRLRIKGLTAIDGEIVWQHRNHAGVRFRVPLHPALIEHLAFRDSGRGCEIDAPAPLAETESAVDSLNGHLVRHTCMPQEESGPSRAAVG
jgi:hypothetical protein